MLSLIIAESALERIPAAITGHPSVTSTAKKFGKYPGRMMLDKSWHFGAMLSLNNKERRGRPDIVHLCMLAACGTPLYMKDLLRVYVHTITDKVIEIGQGVRIPKSYHRFAGLLEDLYLEKKITDDSGHMLAEITDCNFTELIETIEPDVLIGMSTSGSLDTYGNIAAKFDGYKDGCIVIGGFPKGHFNDKVAENLKGTRRHTICLNKNGHPSKRQMFTIMHGTHIHREFLRVLRVPPVNLPVHSTCL